MLYKSSYYLKKTSVRLSDIEIIKSFFRLSAIIFVGLLISVNIWAQEVNYTVIENDPEKAAKLNLSLDPFVVDTWRPNVSMGWGFSANYYVMSRLSAAISYNQSYFQLAEYKDPDSTPKTINIEGIAQFAMFKKVKNENLKVVLSSSTQGRYSVQKFINVEGPKLYKYNLRFGAQYFSSPYKLTEVRDGEVIGSDGSIAPSGLVDQISTTTLVFGFSREKQAHLKVNIDDKIKGNGAYARWFIDVLYSPSISVEDIIYGPITYPINPENGVAFKNIGWRYGLDYFFKTHKPVDMSMKFEVGQRTGFATGSFYAKLSFGIGIHML